MTSPASSATKSSRGKSSVLTGHFVVADPVKHELGHQHLELLVAGHELAPHPGIREVLHLHHRVELQLRHQEVDKDHEVALAELQKEHGGPELQVYSFSLPSYEPVCKSSSKLDRALTPKSRWRRRRRPRTR